MPQRNQQLKKQHDKNVAKDICSKEAGLINLQLSNLKMN